MSGTGHIDHNDWKNGHAPHVQADRRTARTRAALHTALIRLILEKDYDAISVGDIAEAANVGRSTFYIHFTGKDDLLRNGADMMREMLTGNAHAVGDERPFAFASFLFAHTRDELRLYRALAKSRAAAIVLGRFRQTLGEVVRAEVERIGPPQDAVLRDVTVQYLVGALMSVLTSWLDRGAKEPPERMDAVFRELALRTVGASPSHRPGSHLRDGAFHSNAIRTEGG